MLTEIPGDDGPVVYAADLIPGRAWVHLPITMGYDRYPEQLIDEKTDLLTRLLEQGGRLFFTHDHEVALGRLARDAKGRFFAEETWPSSRARHFERRGRVFLFGGTMPLGNGETPHESKPARTTSRAFAAAT